VPGVQTISSQRLVPMPVEFQGALLFIEFGNKILDI
jgi:hypothetical protein